MIRLVLFFLAAVLFHSTDGSALTLPHIQTSPLLKRYEYRQLQMGTVFRIIVYAAAEHRAKRAAAAAFKRIE